MKWRGVRPIMWQTSAVSERGVWQTMPAFRPIADRLLSSTNLRE